ncbi:hypothetical protein PENFLA_c050G10754 [Penicillium flavigenum]|uniref:NACHT domain-containing protein n=1 Tax=Penicillium flavigenum TaxID=254877 RepID=A0A1V6SH08_9EURO|nr:hypothetical protein PENFLA_c050G10754 [Penicillium flavigenum]
MNQTIPPPVTFNNQGDGTQNTNAGSGLQNNNNSYGTQYNNCSVTLVDESLSPEAQQKDQNRIDNDILGSLAFPEMLDRRDNIEQRHGNTCEWILGLEEYMSWRSDSYGLLWIKGKPGAGKSTLMAYLHDKLRESVDIGNGIQLDFFFNARGTDLQRRPLGMFRSLLNQIFRSDEAVRPRLREFYLDRSKKFGNGAHKWEWPEIWLERLLAEAILASASRQRVTIFVDALDEAGSEAARQLADYFYRLNDAAGPTVAVRICISCRHYPIVDSYGAREITIEDHNLEDITTYINDKLSRNPMFRHKFDQDDLQNLQNELVQRTEAVFQWAHIIVPLVQRKLLEGHFPKVIRRWLPIVPADLEDVYKYILECVIDPVERPQVFLFFQWLSLAERPLSVTEMRYALAMENPKMTRYRIHWEKTDGFVETDECMRHRIKALSGGLAETAPSRKGSGTIQVVHQSINEFLRTKGLAFLGELVGASTSPIDGQKIILQCQATVYQSCLAYLAREGSLESARSRRHGDLADFFTERPLLGYATLHIFVHAEKAGECRADKVQNEIQQLGQLIGRWGQLYRGLDKYKAKCPPGGTTLFHLAATANLVDVMDFLSSDEQELTQTDGRGNMALHLAAQWGHIEIAKILLKRGADFEAKNNCQSTPLMEAARCGQLEFVEWLLQNGANIDTETAAGCALQAASRAGHQDAVRLLLEAGANVNAQGGGQYGTALQAASCSGNPKIVRMLLNAKADVNAQGGAFSTALQAASLSGNPKIVRMLLDANADVNTQGGGQYGTALQAASCSGNPKIVRMLLDANADVNTQGGRYGTPLQAASLSRNTKIVRMLLDANADVNAQGGAFSTALQAASYKGSDEIVRMILDIKRRQVLDMRWFGAS